MQPAFSVGTAHHCAHLRYMCLVQPFWAAAMGNGLACCRVRQDGQSNRSACAWRGGAGRASRVRSLSRGRCPLLAPLALLLRRGLKRGS